MKKYTCTFILLVFIITSCTTPRQTQNMSTNLEMAVPDEGIITQSLFTDQEARISEENIQKILDGKYTLPQQLRVAVVNIDNGSLINRRYGYDEDYLSSCQKYLSTLITNMEGHQRVQKVSLVPDIMMSTSPGFTSIREAAVRMQADVVLVYSIRGGMYSKYKVFSADEHKAFATTQVLIMDVRTGLVPFSTVVTEDYLSKKLKDDFNGNEAEKRIQEEAVMKTLIRVCDDINLFLTK
ncbi:hypothetical protein JGH11_04275 [Dysgonomonas sp. Marseille-P4677]|uniref:hypothetical protein n=1 Tax=Dysgonomonas sp. Marseille-P4677 TaxID=2364790 RepID=UPI001913E7D4|nr:hypothetical protein [Dysgonomonas sp. Marseille-P4677]MBK5720082.1 hypothetical protein [Dysgonomonas sp. Marseille-P4677]